MAQGKKISYKKITADFLNDYRLGRRNSQFDSILNELADSIFRSVKKKPISEDDYLERLSLAHDILWSSAHCFNTISSDEDDEEKRKDQLSRLWFHQDINDYSLSINNWKRIGFDKDILLSEVARYLKATYLKSKRLEWVFLNAMIFYEIRGFYENLIAQKLGITYLLSNSDQLTYWVMKLGLFVLKYFSAFVVGISVGYFASPDEYLDWGIGAILITLGLTLVSKLYNLISRIFIKSYLPSFNQQKALFIKMSKIYSLTGAEVIHPSRLESDLLEVSKQGAVWDYAIYSLVAKIKKRNPTQFIR